MKTSLKDILGQKDSFYHKYFIKKKSGKKRQICEPDGDIIGWQALAKEWFDTFPLHESAHGFREERSVITNALPHTNQKYVLNMDLKDFFPSVTSYMVFKAIKDFVEEAEGFSGSDELGTELLRVAGMVEGEEFIPDNIPFMIAEPLTALCTLDSCLPQGSCTSPVLSNIIATPMDYELRRLADSQGLAYTRYADDLTFSGKEIPKWFIGRVQEIVESLEFTVHPRKVKLTGYYQRQVVTGIVVNNETLGVSKKVRNKLRQHLHFLGLRGEEIDESSQGLLEFIRSVKPEQYESLLRTYNGEWRQATTGGTGELGTDHVRLHNEVD